MLRIFITDMSGQCALKNIFYPANQAFPGGQKRGRNVAKLLIVDNFSPLVSYTQCKSNDTYFNNLRVLCEFFNDKQMLLVGDLMGNNVYAVVIKS